MNRHPLLALCIAALAALAGTLSSQESDAWYMGKPIKGIEFQGLKAVSKGDMEGITRPYLGKDFSDELFLELQSRVNEADYFESIEPVALPGDKEGKSIIIRFLVTEKEVIESIKFEGNHGIKALDLLAVVVSKTGDLSNKETIAADEEAIRRLYLDKGYSAVRVSSEERKTEKGTYLYFVVDEGSQIVVKSVRVLGSQAFSEKTLKAKLSIKEQGLFVSGAFQEEKVEESREILLSYYRNRGYVDAAVSPAEISRESDEKKKRDNATVTYTVTEGVPYLYAGLEFDGNVIFATAKLQALVLQKKGQAFNQSKFNADLDRVRNLYYENGYVFSQITAKQERDEDARTLSFVIQIVERDRAHISDIKVKGNTKTKDKVILREFPIGPGDIFSKRKIEEGYRNLLNLQYFSSIYPEIIPVSEQIVDLVLNVTEQSTAGFNFGMTYIPSTSGKNAFPIGGFVKWNDSNFLGNGQNFAIGTEFTADTQSLTFSFTESWLADRRWLGGVNLSFNHEQKRVAQDILAPHFGSGVPDPYGSYEEYEAAGFAVPEEYKMTYDSVSMGAGANTGYVWKLGLGDLGAKVGVNASLENILYDDMKYRPYDALVRENHNNWLFSDGLTLYGYWNNLDYSFNPSKGIVLTQKFYLGGFTPLESQQYLREDLKAEAFLTLFNLPVTGAWKFKMVLGAHSSYTGLFPKPGLEMRVKAGSYPKVDGMMTMRGWGDLSGFDATGIFYNWLELRMPIAEQYLWLDFFIDAAAVQTREGLLQPTAGGLADPLTGRTLADMGADSFAFSAGAMLRLTIPQFPFKIGLAKNFIYRDGALRSVSGDIFKTSDAASGFNLVLSLSQALY